MKWLPRLNVNVYFAHGISSLKMKLIQGTTPVASILLKECEIEIYEFKTLYSQIVAWAAVIYSFKAFIASLHCRKISHDKVELEPKRFYYYAEMRGNWSYVASRP